MGFDPSNRFGTGGNAGEVHVVAGEILAHGWSWSKTSHAVCVEVPPGDDAVELFNQKLCGPGSNLAPVAPGSIKFGSIACGHTNMGLRAIAVGMPSPAARMCEDGRLSLARLRAVDADYAKAVTDGLRWKVLRASVRTQYPAALEIIQVVFFCK